MNLDFNLLFKVNDGEATTAIERVIKKIEEIGKRSQAAASTKVSDIIPEASLKKLALKMPKGAELPNTIVDNLSNTLGSLQSNIISSMEFELQEVILAARKMSLNPEEKAALAELEESVERLRTTRVLASKSMTLDAKQFDRLSTVFSKITGQSVTGMSPTQLLAGIGNSLSQFDSEYQDKIKQKIGSLNIALDKFTATPGPITQSDVNAALQNLITVYDDLAVKQINARNAQIEASVSGTVSSEPLTREPETKAKTPAGHSGPPESQAAINTLRLMGGDIDKNFDVDKAIESLRILGTSQKNLKQAAAFLSSTVGRIEQEVAKSALSPEIKEDFARKLDLLRVELADFYNKAKTTVADTTAEVKAETAAVTADADKAKKKTTRGRGKAKAKDTEAVVPTAAIVSPEVVAEVKSTRTRAKRALTETEIAEKEVGNAIKGYKTFFNDITTVLRTTTSAANIEAGGIISPETFNRQLQVYSTQINSFLNSADDFFKSFSIGGKQLKPGEFLSKVNLASISRLTDIQARNQRIGRVVSGISGQFDLTPEQKAAFEATLAKSLSELANRYTALSRSVSALNAEQLNLAKAQSNTLVQQNDYAGALETLKSVTLTSVRRNKDGTFGTETRAIGDIGFDVKSLTGFGLSKRQSLAIIKQQKQLEAEIAKLEDIRRQKPSGGGIGGFNLPGFARFAGQALTAFSFLSLTIGTGVQQLALFLDQANRLEKASATVSALTGNFGKFTDTLKIATTQQSKFGGTLEEQLQGLSSLVPISKRYNVSLEQLDNIARRLAIIDPLQGFSGASIALKEFFSGDITSLSRRFEIDRKTLNSIKNVGDQADQLQQLDKVLSELGISQAVLEARTNTAAASFDKAGAAWSNYTTLIGQSTQTALRPAADAIAELFASAGDELAENLANSQKYQEILVNFKSVTNSASILKKSLEDINFDMIVSDGNSTFNSLEVNAISTAKEVNQLRDELNGLIIELNKIREASGEEPLILLRTSSAAAKEEVYQLGLAIKDLPVDSIERILEARSQNSWEKFWSDLTGETGEFVYNYAEFYKEFLKTDEDFQARLQSGEKGTKGNVPVIKQAGIIQGNFEKLSSLDQQIATEYSQLFLEAVQDEAFSGKARGFVDKNRVLFSGDAFVGLTDREKLIKFITDFFSEVAKGQKGVEDLSKFFVEFTNSTDPALKNVRKIINGIYDVTEQLNRIQEPSKNIQNATDLYKESLSTVNKFLTERYNAEMKNLALQYFSLDVSDRAALTEKMRARQLLEMSEDVTATEYMKLKTINDADRAQAQFIMNQNKSISAAQALNGIFGQYVVSLEEIARLTQEWVSSMNGLTTGTLLSQLTTQDQLTFNRMSLAGQIPGLAPQNQNDATNLLSSIYSSQFELENEAFNSGQKRAEKLADLEEKYIDDKRKAEEDYEKDRTKLAEDYEKRRRELLKESEVGKRESRSGFYKTLMGTEGLTDEQMRQASADYEVLFQRASELRNQGEFEKAQSVLSAGVEEILNRVSTQEEIAKNRQDIIDADEEIADLQKDLAKETDIDDRKEIQRKIDKANQDKLNAENRIKQIENVAKLEADTDAERVIQAENTEDTITTNYENELAERKQAYETKLKEMDEAYKKSVEEATKADNSRAKKQLINIMDLIMLQDYVTSVQKAANALITTSDENSPEYRAAKAVADANKQSLKIYFDNTNSILKDDFETYMNVIENQLSPSLNQAGADVKGLNLPKSPMIVATEDNTEATKKNTEAIDKLAVKFSQIYPSGIFR